MYQRHSKRNYLVIISTVNCGMLKYGEGEEEEDSEDSEEEEELINSRGGYEDGDRMNILLKSYCGINKRKMSIDWDQYKYCVFGM